DETKAKVVNAVTLEVTPEQAEKLDLARSVGTLSLALRNQIDKSPGTTDGVRTRDLLRLRAETGTAFPSRSKPAAPKPTVEIIRGIHKTEAKLAAKETR
ncbi:MAG: Flp pilus assembly protein CpaB, partial [Nitrosospira sp.]|nr:Flp pilus assembly protein CpaB [Nitrosospira sp.]